MAIAERTASPQILPGGPLPSSTAHERGVCSFETLIGRAGGRMTVRVVVDGDLDCDTAPRLLRLLDALAGQGLSAVLLDLSRARFVDSAGIRVMLKAKRRLEERQGFLRLQSPSARLAGTLDLLGLRDVLSVGDPGDAGHAARAGSTPAQPKLSPSDAVIGPRAEVRKPRG